ncbi:MAG: right-handed parallel beta-helix repeat-containing protein [Sulfitobacter sp.]
MAIIYAAPEITKIKVPGSGTSPSHRWAYDLQTAINRARPGDTVRLIAGHYTGPATISASGKTGKPITIEGPKDGEAIFDGGQSPENGQNTGLKPLDSDFSFLKVFGAKKLILKRLTFKNNWPSSIYMRGAADIRIADCAFTAGRFAIYARQGVLVKTKHILVERCTWVQDPQHKMWNGDVTWEQVKLKDPSYDASYFNGALFGSFDITGGVTIRDCAVSHAFNAIRMDVRPRRIRKTQKNGPKVSRNRDVAIYRNTFSFIRDNAIEPETGAENWRIFNNQFFNIHGTFTFDGVACRDMFYVGNIILNNRKPEKGQTEYSGGKIFKFLGLTDTEKVPLEPRKHVWSVFNSVQTRTSYAKKSRTMFWRDAYNAVGMYDADHPISTANPRHAFTKFQWDAGDILVLGMATNDPIYPDGYPANNINQAGLPKLAKVFLIPEFEVNPDRVLGGWNGNLAKSAALAALTSNALRITRAGGGDFKIAKGFAPGAHDIADLGLDLQKGVALPKL